MRGAALALVLGAGLVGCASEDACRGRSETCLSLTLLGAEGVTELDQLQLVLRRMPRPLSPAMRLPSPQTLPFKVAVLWPDGPGTLSVRGYREGVLRGVTPELALDLRGGAHARRVLTLYPPLAGGDADLGAADLHAPDLRAPDLRLPPDQAMPPDLAGDQAMPPDLAGDQATPPQDGSPVDLDPAG
ncbi:MAG: hypothetical protein RMK29_15400 [Myxococcales bacterium]|nr:hypothetical protein [Myxococcales bacterium]